MEILIWFALGFGVVGIGLGFFALWAIYRVNKDMMELICELYEEDCDEDFDEMEQYQHEVYIN